MKIYYVVLVQLLFLCYNGICQNNKILFHFKKINKKYIEIPVVSLFDNIIPKNKLKYYELRYYNPLKNNSEILSWKGDSIRKWSFNQNVSNYSGFIYDDLLMGGYYYIIALNLNDSIEIINSKDKMIDYMGEIDNLEELVYSIYVHGYYFDKKRKKLCSYKKVNDGFLINMAYEKNCTVYSVQSKLNINGTLIILKEEVFKKTIPCIVF